MTWRDRDGELLDDEPAWVAGPPLHPDDCDGWLGEDTQGRPVPCLTCRPHLRRRRTVSRTVANTDHRGDTP